MRNLTVNTDDTQSCQGTDVGNIQDVSIGGFGPAKLRLEPEGLFIKVYIIRFKFYEKLQQEIHIRGISIFQTKLTCN